MNMPQATLSYIYGLFDPDEQVIRYVGQSTRPVARLGGHQSLNSSSNGVLAKAWVAKILQQNRRPHMIILEVCDFSVAHELEAKWYQRIKDTGVNLVNEPKAIRRTKVHDHSKPYDHRLEPQQYCIIEPECFYICHEPNCADTMQKFGVVLEFVSAWQEPTITVAITLLSSQVEAMKQLGDGNLSAGIRKVIETMTTETHRQQLMSKIAATIYGYRMSEDDIANANKAGWNIDIRFSDGQYTSENSWSRVENVHLDSEELAEVGRIVAAFEKYPNRNPEQLVKEVRAAN